MRKAAMKKPPTFPYWGMEDFLLQHGQEYQYAPLPKGVERGTIKMCFQNAWKLAKKKKWHYVEGMAMGIIPTHHAWCLDPKNPTIAIDPTWSESLVPVENRFYIGVPFNLELVGKTRKKESCVLDDWRGGFPLYTGELKESDWRVVCKS
jgi:hypothetical protein